MKFQTILWSWGNLWFAAEWLNACTAWIGTVERAILKTGVEVFYWCLHLASAQALPSSHSESSFTADEKFNKHGPFQEQLYTMKHQHEYVQKGWFVYEAYDWVPNRSDFFVQLHFALVEWVSRIILMTREGFCEGTVDQYPS